MIVHPHEAGNNRAAREVHDARSGGNRDVAAFPDFPDRAVLDDNGLIGNGRSSRAVDHPHVLQGHDRRVHTDKAFRNR